MIEFQTAAPGKKVSVNPNHVVAVQQSGDFHSQLMLVGGQTILVEVEYEEAVKMLRN